MAVKYIFCTIKAYARSPQNDTIDLGERHGQLRKLPDPGVPWVDAPIAGKTYFAWAGDLVEDGKPYVYLTPITQDETFVSFLLVPKVDYDRLIKK